MLFKKEFLPNFHLTFKYILIKSLPLKLVKHQICFSNNR